MQPTISTTDPRPGADLVRRGLEDLDAGRCTMESCLVSLARSRLEGLGFSIPHPIDEPEQKLYELLSNELGNGAHSRYNALRRRLLSFLRASACGNP